MRILMDLVLLPMTISVAGRVSGETVEIADGVAGKTVMVFILMVIGFDM